MEFDDYRPAIVKILGVALIIFIIIVYLHDRGVSAEYPFPSHEDAINDEVKSVTTLRNSNQVIFKSGKKYHLPWAQNKKYSFLNLSELISSGDHIRKNKFSDTLKIRHLGKEYIFVLEEVINE